MTSENRATALGELVRNLREAAGLSRSPLAQETGVSIQTIRDLETGRYHVEPEVLKALGDSPIMKDLPERCRAAGFPLDFGANGVGEKP